MTAPIQRQRWVCFHCRKMFRPGYAHVENARTDATCPDCKAPMRRIGRYFQPPRRHDRKQWEKVRRLLDAGITFDGYQGRPPKRLSEVDAFLRENGLSTTPTQKRRP